jgi:hypothetical protein
MRCSDELLSGIYDALQAVAARLPTIVVLHREHSIKVISQRTAAVDLRVFVSVGAVKLFALNAIGFRSYHVTFPLTADHLVERIELAVVDWDLRVAEDYAGQKNAHDGLIDYYTQLSCIDSMAELAAIAKKAEVVCQQ